MVGLSPGTLVYTGEHTPHAVTITQLAYDATACHETQIQTLAACFPLPAAPTVTWIDIDAIHQVEIIQTLGDSLGLHPLTLEAILNTEQRPNVEEFDAYVHIMLKMLHYDAASDAILAEHISIILAPHCVVSLQDGRQGDVFTPVRERIKSGRLRIRKSGADYLAYALVDAIVDNYFVILEHLEDRIELLDIAVATQPTTATLDTIHTLKREIIALRKLIWPVREVMSGLVQHESSLIGEATEKYLRDVSDHIVQIIDTIETFREMTAALLDIYISSTSNRMNETMKLLTMMSTIFIPLTFIVGLEGMNLRYMPEVNWPWAYPAIWVTMLVIVIGMMVYFRRKKWF